MKSGTLLNTDKPFERKHNFNTNLTGRRDRDRKATISFKDVKGTMVPRGDYALAPNGSIRRLDKLKARLDKQLKAK